MTEQEFCDMLGPGVTKVEFSYADYTGDISWLRLTLADGRRVDLSACWDPEHIDIEVFDA